MVTVRWIRGEGRDSTNTRDQEFPTKREALRAISRVKVSSITRLPTVGGRLYAVAIGKE